ncbi:MAG: cupin domain-containing protein [Trueperaceae bacterium]|nr:cupin domain-containing protein [Trueperaceae bacterium]
MSEFERIYNSVQKDWVTFLTTAKQSSGEYSLIEVELSPGGGVAPHFHTRFAETFTAIRGQLSILLEKDILVLETGASVTAKIGILHRFFNASQETIRFQVMLSPGDSNFENALRTGYGLASAGKTNAKSMPKNMLELAVLADWSNTVMPGPTAKIIKPVFKQLLQLAKYRGVDQRLFKQYCQNNT